MIVIYRNFKFDEKDNLTHIRLPFALEKTYNSLKIHLNYSPSRTPDDITRELSIKGEEKYIPKQHQVGAIKEFIDNVILDTKIATSLIQNGYYVGGWHNKCPNQDILISNKKSSLGYKRHAITKGNYELVLSLHSVHCPVEATLLVEVLDE